MDSVYRTKRELAKTIRIRLEMEGPSGTEAAVRRTRLIRRTARSASKEPYALLDSVYDGVLITTQDGTITAVNARASVLFRYTREEFKGKSAAELLAGVTGQLLGDFRAYFEKGRFVLIQCYGLRRDGSSFPAEVAVNYLKREPKRLCFLVRDVTIRKRAQDALQMVYRAMNQAPVGIAVLSPEGRVSYANPAFAQVLGVGEAVKLTGKFFHEYVLERDRAMDIVRRVVEQEQGVTAELHVVSTGGRQVPVLVRLDCSRDSDNQVSGVVLSIEDLTEAKKHEELVRRTAQQEAMLASLSTACHHLAQPATVILGYLEILERDLAALDSSKSEVVHAALDAARKLADLLSELNRVNAFRLRPYLESLCENDPENWILDIETDVVEGQADRSRESGV